MQLHVLDVVAMIAVKQGSGAEQDLKKPHIFGNPVLSANFTTI